MTTEELSEFVGRIRILEEVAEAARAVYTDFNEYNLHELRRRVQWLDRVDEPALSEIE